MRVPFITGRELISACEYHSSNIVRKFVTGRELISVP